MLCYNVTKYKAKKFFCKHCIHNFASESILQKHKEDCMLLTKCQAIEMPAEGEVTKFKSFRETVKIPFVIYADLEALLHKLTVSQKQEMEQDQTEKLQKHVACSYGYKVVCCYDKKLCKPFKMYRGVDSVNKFFSDIFEEEEEILEKLKEFKTLPWNYRMKIKLIVKMVKIVTFAIVALLLKIMKFEIIIIIITNFALK